MKYRRLGRTGLQVSVVGLGTWQFGGEWGHAFSQGEVDRIIGRAKEVGINLIDTAECYGDHLSESLVGNAVARDRDSWILATKFGHKFQGFRDRTQHWSAAEVQEQLEASLAALRTDHVDIYQFHSGADEYFDNDELWEMLRRQKEAGKIRFLGISVGPVDRPHQVERATAVGADVVQIRYNRLERAAEEALFPSCIEQDLGVLARVPLASGFLSGRYKPGTVFAEGDVRHYDRGREEKLRQVEAIARTEVPEGVDMATWALAWCLQHPAVSCVIPGCKSVEQVEANARAAELDLVREDHPQGWKE